MARYIDAEHFAERLKVSPAFPNYTNGLFMRDVVLDILGNMPTADVVEVVRCKDCKWYEKDPWGGETLCQCWADWLPTYQDDFCSCGERKEQT